MLNKISTNDMSNLYEQPVVKKKYSSNLIIPIFSNCNINNSCEKYKLPIISPKKLEKKNIIELEKCILPNINK
jgi:hypothetical protein